jgi:hypothetical protein
MMALGTPAILAPTIAAVSCFRHSSMACGIVGALSFSNRPNISQRLDIDGVDSPVARHYLKFVSIPDFGMFQTSFLKLAVVAEHIGLSAWVL